MVIRSSPFVAAIKDRALKHRMKDDKPRAIKTVSVSRGIHRLERADLLTAPSRRCRNDGAAQRRRPTLRPQIHASGNERPDNRAHGNGIANPRNREQLQS